MSERERLPTVSVVPPAIESVTGLVIRIALTVTLRPSESLAVSRTLEVDTAVSRGFAYACPAGVPRPEA